MAFIGFKSTGNVTRFIIAELWRPEGQPSGAPYSYGKQKETHELIFSWLSWLAVLLVGAYYTPDGDDDDGIAQHGGHTPNNGLTERHAALVYCVLL